MGRTGLDVVYYHPLWRLMQLLNAIQFNLRNIEDGLHIVVSEKPKNKYLFT